MSYNMNGAYRHTIITILDNDVMFFSLYYSENCGTQSINQYNNVNAISKACLNGLTMYHNDCNFTQHDYIGETLDT